MLTGNTRQDDPGSALADLYKSEVAVHECLVGDYVDTLGECESRSAARMRESRQHEFSSGRHCARQAAASLKLTPNQRETIEDIAVGNKRDPQWPAGMCGSISHDGMQAIAVVSNDPFCDSVGLDLIDLDAMERMTSVSRLIATRDEIANAVRVLDESSFITGILEGRVSKSDSQSHDISSLAACVIFSVKESVFKCVYPRVRDWIGLLDAQVELSFDLDPGLETTPIGQKSLENSDAQELESTVRVGSYTVSFRPKINALAHQLVGSPVKGEQADQVAQKPTPQHTPTGDTAQSDTPEFAGYFLLTPQRIVSTAELFYQNPC